MTEKYSIGKTMKKAAPPFVVLFLIQALKQSLAQLQITVDDDTLYSIAIGGYGAVIGFINWLKNRNKGKSEATA